MMLCQKVWKVCFGEFEKQFLDITEVSFTYLDNNISSTWNNVIKWSEVLDRVENRKILCDNYI